MKAQEFDDYDERLKDYMKQLADGTIQRGTKLPKWIKPKEKLGFWIHTKRRPLEKKGRRYRVKPVYMDGPGSQLGFMDHRGRIDISFDDVNRTSDKYGDAWLLMGESSFRANPYTPGLVEMAAFRYLNPKAELKGLIWCLYRFYGQDQLAMSDFFKSLEPTIPAG